jgi:hypothetical protein
MRTRKLPVIITMAVALGFTSAPAAGAPADPHQAAALPAAETVAVPGGPCGDADLGTNCQAYFPDLVKDPKGDADDLLLVYRWSSEHTKKASQLRMVRSRDGGATWQQATPFIVADQTGVDFRDPSLTAMRNGRLLLSYFTADAAGALGQTQVRRRDTDNAAFSTPSRVWSSTIPLPVTSAKIVEMTNGQLLIPLYGTPSGGGNHHAVVVASVDGGVTWDGRVTGRQKTIASGSTLRYQEPAIAEVAPGHVRALVRTASSTGASANAVQTDSYNNTYMSTWSTPSSLGVMMHGPELLAIPGTSYVPYLWSEPNAASGPTNRPTRIAVRRGNVAWPDTPRYTLYNPSVTFDSGYPGTVALDTSRLVTVVYDEARRAAIVLRYTVADVD